MKYDISKLLLPFSRTIRDALEILNSGYNRYRIVFLMDDQNKIKGCVTDGDIRRALLRGEALTSSIEKAARKEFVWLPKSTSNAIVLEKMKKTGVRQIPMLDSDGRLMDVKIIDDLILAEAKLDFPVVIMAGGVGSRLRPHTDHVPKPMLKVGDQALIERLITEFRAKGVKSFYVSVNYLAEQIMDCLGDGTKFDCSIEYVIEDRPLGTAGSLSLLKDKIKTDFLMINGDVLTSVDFMMLEEFHCQHLPVVTVCTKIYTVSIPYGVVKTEGDDLVRIDEKPNISFPVNAGIYFFSPKIFSFFKVDEKIDMTDLLDRLIAEKIPVKCFQSLEPWIDIGSHLDFEKAQKYLGLLTQNH